jgi:AcrR family transcriptional regulator
MNKPQSPQKRQAKEKAITDVARKLFLSKGIGEVKMTDIAQDCQIGVATLYRYFKVKKAIVIKVGMVLWEEIASSFEATREASHVKGLNGYESIKALMYNYLDIFKSEKDKIKFFRSFDSYAVSEKIPPKELSPYEEPLLKIHELFMEEGQRGVIDGSVRPGLNYSLAYFAIAKALLGLCYRMVSQDKILSSDQQLDAESQIKALIDVSLYYFQNIEKEA